MSSPENAQNSPMRDEPSKQETKQEENSENQATDQQPQQKEADVGENDNMEQHESADGSVWVNPDLPSGRDRSVSPPPRILLESPAVESRKRKHSPADSEQLARETHEEWSQKQFYLRYYVTSYVASHHRQTPVDVPHTQVEVFMTGLVRWRNVTGYPRDIPILKEFYVSELLLDSLKRIVRQSDILSDQVSDEKWPTPEQAGIEKDYSSIYQRYDAKDSRTNMGPNRTVKEVPENLEEMEIVLDNTHVLYRTKRMDSLTMDVMKSDDPDGLTVFFNTKKAIMSWIDLLINMHTKRSGI